MTVSGKPVSIPFEVWRISRRMRLLLDTELFGTDITPGELGLYSVLYAGPMTPTEVARHSGIPPTTVSKMLQKIEDRGHLQRERNPADGRSMLVSLTKAGAGFHADAMGAIKRVRGYLRDVLADDEEWVSYALLRLERALSDITGGATAGEEKERWPFKGRWGARLPYDGEPLTAEQEQTVRDYIDWIRHRDGERSA